MNGNNDSKTKSFEALDLSADRSPRQKIVMAIFVVIILILLSFTVLIFGQIFSRSSGGTGGGGGTQPPVNDDTFQVYMDSADVKIGNLLLINGSFPHVYPTEQDNLVSVYEFKNNAANDGATKITVGGKKYPTYELGSLATSIVLDATALEQFNRMMLDYCKTLDLSDLAEGSNASNVNVAWGYSDEESLEDDIKSGLDFYDHALGTAVTLRRNSDSAPITEDIFKNDYKWLYDNCYKYGFILRYPNDCKDKTGLDGSDRVHLRYVGYEHAYYMHSQGICLDEYLELIRTQHTASGEHLTFTADNGSSYEVYYVAATGNPTGITLKKGSVYTVSGDNMNGFIITITK